MTKHAVLEYSRFYDCLYLVYGDTYTRTVKDVSLESLAESCETDGITHLWVHAATELNKTSKDIESMQTQGYDVLVQYDLDDHVISLHGYKKYERGRSKRFNIIFLAYTNWDWQELAPREVLEIVQDLEINLQIPVGGSPAGVGMRYLQKVTEKRPLWLSKPDIDLSSLPWNAAARPLIWQRQPDREEIERKYLYAVDKNAAHPRAAKEEQFGFGNPTHMGECSFCPDFPGMWRVDILYSPDLDERLPSPVWNGFDWLATPIVKLLIKTGHEIRVQEAWVFEKHAHIFRQWVDDLWELRREREGHERDAYKSIMNDTLGLLRSGKIGTNTFKFRPDWNMMVVAGTRAVMYYNLMKYVLKGLHPIMCQLDALYYLSNEESLTLAVPEILNHQHSLGGYKLKFKIPTDEVEEGMTVRAILASNKPQPQKLRLLNKIAARCGYDG